MENRPLRSTDVRDRNQKLILRLLFQDGPLSQSQIVRMTGLKAPTVFRIFARLQDDQFIRPSTVAELAQIAPTDRKGRRPSYFSVVPDAMFAIGVDFSTWGASVIVVNFANQVIYHETAEFSTGVTRNVVLSTMESMITTARNGCGIDPLRLLGIGIGAPGTVNTETGTVVDYARIEGLAGFSLGDHFQSACGVPVLVHNNASVIAASEYHYDAAVDYDSVLAVLVRGGVGAAFVNHGEIFLNGGTTALEMGRMMIGSETVEDIVGEGPLLEVLCRAEGVRSWNEAESRVDADRLGEILSGPADSLATAVRNLYHILHPDAVLVISRFAKLAVVLTTAVRDTVPEAVAIPITYDPAKACYGATDLVFQRYFLNSSAFDL